MSAVEPQHQQYNLWCYAVFLQGPPLRMLSVTRDMAVVVVAGPDHAVVDTTTVEIDTIICNGGVC